MNPVLIPIFLPLIAAPLIPAVYNRIKWFKETVTTVAALAGLIAALSLFGQDAVYSMPWAGFGFDFSLRVYAFSAFAVSAIMGFALLISIYSWVFMKDKPHSQWYYFNFLFTLGFACGAVLANNLVLLLFFWEGLLLSLYGFIALARKNEECKHTAMKAFILNGVGDLCLIVGVGIVVALAGTSDISAISADKIQLSGWGFIAFVLMMIGATGKAGALPLHTWIPDAAKSAQLPFMAFLPAALEKILGIYLLARISLDIFDISSCKTAQIVLMTLGALTILVAVMMALAQSNYKRLLSYHAISQVGYMILGIGTANPIGITGGVLHMINHAVYKSGLFLTAGSVEHRAGTSDIYKLGGLFRQMPFTAVCFIITACSIAGVAPFNGFFSKELIYDGALKTGFIVFFIAAELGTFLTMASFLKLGHAVYFGEKQAELKDVKESPWSMLAPMGVLALICIVFGFGAKLPLSLLVAPSLKNTIAQSAEPLYGFHFNWLFAISLGVLALALLNHYFGVKKSGSGKKASDHICKSPTLYPVYKLAEQRVFDPYDQGMKLIYFVSRGLFSLDRVFDFITDTLPSTATGLMSSAISKAHSGSISRYLVWTLAGFIFFAIFIFGVNK